MGAETMTANEKRGTTSWTRMAAGALGACAAALVAAFGQAAEPHHIHLATSSPIESVKWYLAHLDCQAIDDRPEAIDCGGMEIEFVSAVTLGGSQGTGVNHIALSVPDVTAKMQELEDVGVRGSGVRLQRFEDGSLTRSISGVFEHGFIFDPWGTRIELVEDPDLIGFHHVHLQSTDPAAALDWYAKVLGGERSRLKGEWDGLRFEHVWLFFEQYPESRGRPAPTDERSVQHLGFLMSDLDSAAERLASQGAEVQTPMVPDGGRSEAKRALLAGPDGVLIAVVEPGWAGVDAAAQFAVESADTEPYSVPQTPWGEPDLQGIWTGNPSHGIPLERPEALADAEALTPQQAAARRERGTLGSIWGYEREWRDTTLGYDKTAISTQVAMVIDPPDGRLPPLTEKGQAWAAAAAKAREERPLAGGPEDLSTYVRCITRGLPGMMMPGVYNNGLQIVQSPGYVAIQKEMIHETRVIPTTEKPRHGVDQWLGTSRGHWEGDTLVIEVKGFNGKSEFRGAGENMVLTERYRRVGPDQLEYTFTVEDPTIWTTPWTGMFHFAKDDSQYELVEYACHEGNYGMTNILSAARARERENAEGSGE
ncbi:MAG: VOC family protein [Gammaproteobacteria bacterium]